MVKIYNWPRESSINADIESGNAILTTIDADTSDIQLAVGTHDSVKPTKGIIGLSVAETTVPTAVADGDAVQQWTDEYGRQIIKGTNLSEESIDTIQVSSAPMANTYQTGITQLTAPGLTSAVDISEYSVFGYTVTAAAIDTSATVDLQGSIDGTNYATLPLDITAVTNTTIIANQMIIGDDGTFIIYSSAPVRYVKFNFASESGGTACTLDVDFFARRS